MMGALTTVIARLHQSLLQLVPSFCGKFTSSLHHSLIITHLHHCFHFQQGKYSSFLWGTSLPAPGSKEDICYDPYDPAKLFPHPNQRSGVGRLLDPTVAHLGNLSSPATTQIWSRTTVSLITIDAPHLGHGLVINEGCVHLSMEIHQHCLRRKGLGMFLILAITLFPTLACGSHQCHELWEGAQTPGAMFLVYLGKRVGPNWRLIIQLLLLLPW